MTLKSLAIMSPLGTMFVHEGTERRVSWRQAVRAEVIAVSISIQVQRYPMFARFVAVVSIAHEGHRESIDRCRQSVYGYDAGHLSLQLRRFWPERILLPSSRVPSHRHVLHQRPQVQSVGIIPDYRSTRSSGLSVLVLT